MLHSLLHETTLLVKLLDSLVEALIGKLFVKRLIVLVLLANLALEPLHIGLVTQ